MSWLETQFGQIKSFTNYWQSKAVKQRWKKYGRIFWRSPQFSYSDSAKNSYFWLRLTLNWCWLCIVQHWHFGTQESLVVHLQWRFGEFRLISPEHRPMLRFHTLQQVTGEKRQKHSPFSHQTLLDLWGLWMRSQEADSCSKLDTITYPTGQRERPVRTT